jgi:hypothetical protein
MYSHSLSRLICIVMLLLAGLAGSTAALAQGVQVGGRNATLVSITERGKLRGEIRKVDATTWIETDAAGEALFKYEEVKRDDSTVYLADKSRDVTLQLDIRKRSAAMRDMVTQKREVYQIQAASDGPVQPMKIVQADAAPAPAKGRAAAKGAKPEPGFCWNDTVPRATGTIPGRLADCPEGYALSGGSCKRAASTVAAPSRAADCPAGYTNTGASCERPAHTKANTNARPADCPEGYNNTGAACFRLSAPAPLDMSKMSCKAGESRIEGRCYKACEAGFTGSGASCTRAASTLGGDNLSCKAGFQKSGKSGRCMAVCAAGYTNTGEACVRAADTLGVEAMLCKAGETRTGGRCLPAGGACAAGEVAQGELCYKACAPGFDGIGATCIKQPGKAWVQCGTGLAKDAQACAATQFDALTALRQLAVAAGQAGTSRLGRERATTRKKFKDMADAFGKARELPAFKKALDAWNDPAKEARLTTDNLAGAADEDDMVRYAAQVAQIAELAGATDDAAYPKCASVLPSR